MEIVTHYGNAYDKRLAILGREALARMSLRKGRDTGHVSRPPLIYSLRKEQSFLERMHATTILAVQHHGKSAIGGDGQVTLGNIVMKGDAKKIRRLNEGKVLVGFAGAAADAFALMERFEARLKEHPGSVPRAATELARDWRTDRSLRRLEAMLIVMDRQHLLLVSGTGDVIQPTDGILAIGSGGAYAQAAAKALRKYSDLPAVDIVRNSLNIAGEMCIYTNTNLEVVELE